MATINMHQAKTELSDLVARAEAGEEIVIARRNKPAVKLVPVQAPDKMMEQRKARTLSPEPHADVAPQADIDWFEHAPDDYISKEEIAAYYRKYPKEWDDMQRRVGFAEEGQADFDMEGLREAIEAGREFTIMQGGKEVAKVAPIDNKQRVPGRFVHLRGSLPPNLFDQALTDDELDAWEGKYSTDGDR